VQLFKPFHSAPEPQAIRLTHAVLAELGSGRKVRASMRFQAPPYEAAVDLGARADAILARSIATKRQHDQAHTQPGRALWFDPNTAGRGTAPVPSGFTGFDGRAAISA